MSIKLYQLLLIIGFSFSLGCAQFLSSPVKKHLFASQIPQNRVNTIKGTILNEGYKRITKEDFHREGAIATYYAREISIGNIRSEIEIGLNFKETDAPIGFYKNLGIRIWNDARGRIPEVNAEIDRMETILYEKLLEVSGKENVKRGEKEIYRGKSLREEWGSWGRDRSK